MAVLSGKLSSQTSTTSGFCLHHTKTKGGFGKRNVRASLSLSVCPAKIYTASRLVWKEPKQGLEARVLSVFLSLVRVPASSPRSLNRRNACPDHCSPPFFSSATKIFLKDLDAQIVLKEINLQMLNLQVRTNTC